MRVNNDDPCDVKIVAYITAWCPDCNRSRRVLVRHGYEFVEIDIEKHLGTEEAMRATNGGSSKVPTILIDGPGGSAVLIEPTDGELAEAVRRCATPVLIR